MKHLIKVQVAQAKDLHRVATDGMNRGKDQLDKTTKVGGTAGINGVFLIFGLVLCRNQKTKRQTDGRQGFNAFNNVYRHYWGQLFNLMSVTPPPALALLTIGLRHAIISSLGNRVTKADR